VNPKKFFNDVYEDYDKYLYIPVALIALSVAALLVGYVTQGPAIQLGQDFTGGTTITYDLNQEIDTNTINQIFAESGHPGSNAIVVGENQSMLQVTAPPPEITREEAITIMSDNSIKNFNITDEDILSRDFSEKERGERLLMLATWTFILAFSIMSLVIFISFRDLIPSLAVIFAASADILFAIAAMSALRIPLTPGSLSALLMLIGYSVDTDIVLSSRVLKQKKGSIKDRIWSSTKTGVTMSAGGIAGFTILYAVSMLLVGPSTLSVLSSVMVIGLLADMPFTWFGNAIILKKYVEGDIKIEKYIDLVVPWK